MPTADDTGDIPPPGWLDGEAGPVVRPYTVTRGRARPTTAFDLLAFVQARRDPAEVGPHLQPECRALLRRAGEPVSVAELASAVDLPLGVVRILLGDMLQSGLITLHQPGRGAQRSDDRILKAVINGLRSL